MQFMLVKIGGNEIDQFLQIGLNMIFFFKFDMCG